MAEAPLSILMNELILHIVKLALDIRIFKAMAIILKKFTRIITTHLDFVIGKEWSSLRNVMKHILSVPTYHKVNGHIERWAPCTKSVVSVISVAVAPIVQSKTIQDGSMLFGLIEHSF